MEERFSSARVGAGWENGNTRSPWGQCDPTLWRIKLWGWISPGTARRKPGGAGTRKQWKVLEKEQDRWVQNFREDPGRRPWTALEKRQPRTHRAAAWQVLGPHC